jgi:hypothetical protein
VFNREIMTMKKLPTIAMATVFALASTWALAQGGGGAGSPGVDKTNNSTSSGQSGTSDTGMKRHKAATGAGITTGSASSKKMAPTKATGQGDKTGEKLRN